MNAKLTNEKHGLYSWSNGQDVLSPRYLSANIHRNTYGNPEEGTRANEWTIRLFHRGKVMEARQDVWNLRMVRDMLARIDAAWLEIADGYEDAEDWRIRYAYERIVHEAWMAAADVEIARTHAKLGWK